MQCFVKRHFDNSKYASRCNFLQLIIKEIPGNFFKNRFFE